MKCPDCLQNFFYEYNLNNHVFKVHKKVMKILCLFCGTEIAADSLRKNYCSKRCQQTAARRRTSMRLGIPPNHHNASKLNPLYFD